ncbi:MAG: hypothetical protein WA006_05805 [Rhodoglobus sp.]
MLELKSVMLCDAATVREGLLNVLGAGLTIFWRESFPAPLMADVAVQFELVDVAVEETREIMIRVTGPNDDPALVFEAQMQLVTMKSDENAPVQSVPIALNLRNAGMPSVGIYALHVLIDGDQVGSLSFEARAGRAADEVPAHNPFG